MSSMEPLCRLIGIHPRQLSKEEYLLLEAELIVQLCQELKEYFRKQYKNYFQLMKYTKVMEDTMLDNHLVRLMTNDILFTKEYDLNGIAYYADTPIDVIQETLDGRNTRPSAIFFLRVLHLHRSVRPHLYSIIIEKIIDRLFGLNGKNKETRNLKGMPT